MKSSRRKNKSNNTTLLISSTTRRPACNANSQHHFFSVHIWYCSVYLLNSMQMQTNHVCVWVPFVSVKSDDVVASLISSMYCSFLIILYTFRLFFYSFSISFSSLPLILPRSIAKPLYCLITFGAIHMLPGSFSLYLTTESIMEVLTRARTIKIMRIIENYLRNKIIKLYSTKRVYMHQKVHIHPEVDYYCRSDRCGWKSRYI